MFIFIHSLIKFKVSNRAWAACGRLRLFSAFCHFGRDLIQTVLLSLFEVFIFSMPSKVIITVIELMFLGVNMFWAPIRAHFNSRLAAWAKMRLNRAQNIFSQD